MSLNGNLTRTKLQGADMRDARLQGANLFGAQSQGASLARVGLWTIDANEGTRLGLADLREVISQ